MMKYSNTNNKDTQQKQHLQSNISNKYKMMKENEYLVLYAAKVKSEYKP
ncbi:12333_t:CDS:1, partial [Gigaspora margarita]